MKTNNFINHIGKFIADNKNKRFTPLKTDGEFSLWKDTVTDKYYYSQPSVEKNVPLWFEAECVASMKKEAWESWNFEADKNEFADIIASSDFSGEIEREDGVWIEWFELRHIKHSYSYVTYDKNDLSDLPTQMIKIECFNHIHFPYTYLFDGYIDHSLVYDKNLSHRKNYKLFCREIEKCDDSVVIVSSLDSFCVDDNQLSAELDRLKELGFRIVTTDGFFDSISPSSLDVIARKRNHNLPPHGVMLHKIKMARYKALGKPKGFVLDDEE